MAWYNNENLWGAVISGAASYASSREEGENRQEESRLDARTSIEVARMQGIEARRLSLFEKELEEYYKAQDRNRKRVALDSYGAFSRLGDYAPAGFVQPAVPVTTPKPVVT